MLPPSTTEPPVTPQQVQAAQKKYLDYTTTTPNYNPKIYDTLRATWQTKAEKLKEADVILSKKLLETAISMYNDAPNLPNARKWVAAADEYLKKTIQISDYREAERLKADANKILRQWQNKPKGPAPPPKPKHLPLQTQSEIQKLYEYKELNDALSNLAEEIVSNYENIQQFKASILPKITKLEVMLENYKTKVSQSSNPSMYTRLIKNLEFRLGTIKNLYSERTEQSLPTRKKVSLVHSSTSIQEPRPPKSPSQPPKKPEINSTSIVWFIALMLLL